MVPTVIQGVYGVGRQPPAPYFNLNTVDLTGYAVYAARAAGSTSAATEIEDYRATGEAPMKPGDRRDDSVSIRAPRVSVDYESGAAYRPGMAIAAIYADGTKFGDAKVLAIMIERRRSMSCPDGNHPLPKSEQTVQTEADRNEQAARRVIELLACRYATHPRRLSVDFSTDEAPAVRGYIRIQAERDCSRRAKASGVLVLGRAHPGVMMYFGPACLRAVVH